MATPGVRLGIDVGRARIGVARSDASALLATPVETVPRDVTDAGADVTRIVAILDELDATAVVVGLPLSLSGASTPSTDDSVAFAGRLAAARPAVPVHLVDERLTTVSATAALHQSGRKTKGSRPVIDQIAAVILLQHAIDTERSSGRTPGAVVEPKIGP